MAIPTVMLWDIVMCTRPPSLFKMDDAEPDLAHRARNKQATDQVDSCY